MTKFNSESSAANIDIDIDITTEVPSVVMYTRDSNPFQAEWRRDNKVSQEFKEELRHLPLHQEGLLYRGVTERRAQEYSAALSTSKSIQVAINFAGFKPESALCAYLGYEGYDLESISDFQSEKEVLCLMPDGFQWTDFVGEVYKYRDYPVYLFAPTKELQREAMRLFFEQIGEPMPPLPSHLSASASASASATPWKDLAKKAATAALLMLLL